jgi:hypothetical protein
MEERLVAEYFGEEFNIQVFGSIVDNCRLFIRLMNNNKIVRMYKLIAWQGGKHKRIYIHERVLAFKQIGYLEINTKEQFDFVEESFISNNTKRIVIELVKAMYHSNQWDTVNTLIKIESSDSASQNKNSSQINPTITQRKEEPIINKIKNKSDISALHENLIVPEKSRIDSSVDICESCRNRKICFKRYEKKDACEDYESGIAIMSDFSQYDSRY